MARKYTTILVTLVSAGLLVPRCLFAQVPATRDYTITVRSQFASYRMEVHDSADAPRATFVKLTGKGEAKKLATVNGGALGDSIIAKLYTLDAWQLASPEADDGACKTGADGRKTCETIDDGTDIEIAITSKGAVRSRKYNSPSSFTTDAARRATRLIDFIMEIADIFD